MSSCGMRAWWLLAFLVGCGGRPLQLEAGRQDGSADDPRGGACEARCELGRPAVLLHCAGPASCGHPIVLCYEGNAQLVGCVFDDGVAQWTCVEDC